MTVVDYVPDPEMSFWPTPDELADDLVYRALTPGMGDGGAGGGCPQIRVLEPSAGDGHLIRAVRKHMPRAHVTAVEPAAVRAATLRSSGLADEVHETTLEDFLAAGGFAPFDLVVMNPPFTLPGRPEAWVEQVLALAKDSRVLNICGQISAVVPRILLTGKSKRVRELRSMLHPTFGIDLCKRGVFDPVGAKLSAVTIWLENWRDEP